MMSGRRSMPGRRGSGSCPEERSGEAPWSFPAGACVGIQAVVLVPRHRRRGEPSVAGGRHDSEGRIVARTRCSRVTSLAVRGGPSQATRQLVIPFAPTAQGESAQGLWCGHAGRVVGGAAPDSMMISC